MLAMTDPKTCPHCSTVFWRGLRTLQNWRATRYCTRACGYAAQRLDPTAQFWSKVERRGDDECWGWKAQKRWDGYGRFRNKQMGDANAAYPYKAVFAHRFSYELHHGPIPAGMSVMHTCDRPECTNPKHLRLGSHAENMRDMRVKGRGKGSKLTPELVREIRAKLEAENYRHGLMAELAKEYGVTNGVIGKIRDREIWSYV